MRERESLLALVANHPRTPVDVQQDWGRRRRVVVAAEDVEAVPARLVADVIDVLGGLHRSGRTWQRVDEALPAPHGVAAAAGQSELLGDRERHLLLGPDQDVVGSIPHPGQDEHPGPGDQGQGQADPSGPVAEGSGEGERYGDRGLPHDVPDRHFTRVPGGKEAGHQEDGEGDGPEGIDDQQRTH